VVATGDGIRRGAIADGCGGRDAVVSGGGGWLRGGSRRVAVDLGTSARRVGARTVARLVSLEDGVHGLKTTERRIVLTS
jgi:hypothetical protein